MYRALFIGEDVTLAHVARPLTLAQGLDRGRVDVVFAAGERYRSFIEAAGFSPVALPSLSPEIFARRLARGQPVFRRQEIEQYVEAELNLFERLRPEVVVGDFRLSLGISAVVAGLPYVAIANAYWSPYSTQPFPMPEHRIARLMGPRLAGLGLRLALPLVFWHHARPFNAVRKAYGLPPVASLKHVYTYGTWTVYPDLPCLAPTGNLPTHHRYLGPVAWEPKMPPPEWWDRLPAGLPVVYVSLGSSGRPGLLEAVLEALRPLSVVAMLSTAGAGAEAPRSDRVFAAAYLPGLQAAARAHLVIGNGGSPTNYQALSRGVPVLGLPWNADQYLAMGPLAREGAGILVRAGEATPERIRTAVRTLLRDRRYSVRAQELSREMASFDAPRLFGALLTTVIRESGHPPS